MQPGNLIVEGKATNQKKKKNHFSHVGMRCFNTGRMEETGKMLNIKLIQHCVLIFYRCFYEISSYCCNVTPIT